MSWIWDYNFFFPFLGLSYLILHRNNARKRFQNFLSRVEYERNLGLKFFFFSFSAYIIPFWLKIMPETGFLIFWTFLLFFLEFSCPGQVWTEFATKIFFSLSRPISSPFWLKIMPESVFLVLWNFLLFFRNFLARIEKERNLRLKFFSLFLGLYHPVLAKNNVGKSFLIFLNFLLFFSEFSCPGRVWTEFWTKFFFLSQLISSRFG